MTTHAEGLAVTTWSGFIGQEKMKLRLATHIEAALIDRRPLEHVLLTGPLGSGKSTMARLISTRLADTDGTPEPLLELLMPMDQRSIIAALDRFRGGIVFFDEIHALPTAKQEMLLSLLTSGYVQDRSGGRHPTSWLTVVAATTERDKVLKTLLSRFDIAPEFEDYTDPELGVIVARMARMIDLTLDDTTATALGRAAGGVPRNAEHLVLAARALQTTGQGVSAEEILDFCQVDADGLGELHQRYLKIMVAQRGRAGLKVIASRLQLPEGAMHDLEKLLLDREYIIATPSGRELTEVGRLKAEGSEVGEYRRR